ncbi:hypothetical protein PIB30_022908 [Stylosanthes scabra]|uniref:Uncharacterized protein n=1 Tax=Stylosanthes scabra TaxID=79078 RepID=A0ABU6Z5W1_9FABA|nr:hypothetical protein [Stylosanthes scabra]
MDEIAMEEQVCGSFGDQCWSGTGGSGRSSNGGAWNKRKKKFHAPMYNCRTYAILFQSSTNSNPNRLFFGCSNFKKSTPHYRYFPWLDDFVSSFSINEDAKTCEMLESVKKLEEKMVFGVGMKLKSLSEVVSRAAAIVSLKRASGLLELGKLSGGVDCWVLGCRVRGGGIGVSACYPITGFNMQSPERKLLKRAKATRKSRRKAWRPILQPVRTHPLALGGAPKFENRACAYASEAPMRTHQRLSDSINRGGHTHFGGSPYTISL